MMILIATIYTRLIAFAGDENKVGHLWRLEGARERLQLVRADLMVEGSFDAAIMGCHGVFHTASPVPQGLPNSDPKAGSNYNHSASSYGYIPHPQY